MTSGTTHLSQRLATIHSEDPEAIRREIIEVLRKYIPADYGLFFKCVRRAGGTIYFTAMIGDGDSHLHDALAQYNERPVVETMWLPPHLDPDVVNTFIRGRAYYDDEQLDNLEISQRVFVPLKTGDQMRAVLYDGQRFLGWVGLMRRGVDERFSKREQVLANSALTEIKTALATAELLDATTVDAGIFATMTTDGEVEHASAAFDIWLNKTRSQYLQCRIRCIDSGRQSAGIEIFTGAEVRVVRLDATESVRYLVTVRRAELMTIHPEYWLTERQQEIAEYAIAGATSQEIADTLELSVHTVRSHMKNIYRRLNIASRAEMAALLTHLGAN